MIFFSISWGQPVLAAYGTVASSLSTCLVKECSLFSISPLSSYVLSNSTQHLPLHLVVHSRWVLKLHNSPVNLPNLVSFQLVVKVLLVAYTTSSTFTTSTHISKWIFLLPWWFCWSPRRSLRWSPRQSPWWLCWSTWWSPQRSPRRSPQRSLRWSPWWKWLHSLVVFIC